LSNSQQQVGLAGKVQVDHAARKARLFKNSADRDSRKPVFGNGIRRRLDQGAPVAFLGQLARCLGFGHASRP
jgi:hypothetical protein